MMVRLTSISGSSGASWRITSLEYFDTQIASETICARNSFGQLIAFAHAVDGEHAPQPAVPIDGIDERRALGARALRVHQCAGDLAETAGIRC